VIPLILAVDATHESGSLALARGEQLLEELPLHSPSGFAHVLFGRLSELLERHGLKVADIDCFAAASGPGSFTGVRVGLAFVKGLADALGKPAAAVSNLQAMAFFGSAPLRAVVLDARRGEIYGAVYDAAGRAVSPEVVTKLAAWIDGLPVGELEFVSLDAALPGVALEGTRLKGARVVMVPQALAGAVARIALEAWRRGETGDPAALDANYVRRSDAELLWKE
jgi:tRNA threonylcarbamoyladenosine biosynthesis protein TsaB